MPRGMLHAQVGVLTICGLLTQTLGAQAGSCALLVRVETPFATPLPAAEVITAAGRLRSDSAGTVTFTTMPSGETQLQVRRIGYRPFAGLVLSECGVRGSLTPQIVKLAPQPPALDRVIVRADAQVRFSGPMAGFWERRAKGDGTFFTSVDIDRRNAQRLTDLVRNVPGWGRGQTSSRLSEALIRGSAVRQGAATRETARPGTQQCYPTVVIDGMVATVGELNTDGIDPRSLAGVEVYVDGSRTPTEFWGTTGQGNCGVVALWSRSVENMKYAAPSMQGELTDSVFQAHDVDDVARVAAERSNPVLYPRSMKRSKQSGEATVSLVVLPTGEPWLRSLRMTSATHKEFGDALLEAVATMRFVPARREGNAVAQQTELTVRFEHPDGKQP
jgi:TonB family protein